MLILDSKLSNNFLINFDKTYKVKKFKYSGNGIISKSSLGFKGFEKNNFIKEKINQPDQLIQSSIKHR